jgi:BRCA1-associated protein
VSASFVPNSQDKNGSTNLPEGVVHIFSDPTNMEASSLSNVQVSLDDNMLAVLAVPSWMTPSDFLAFVAPAADGIVNLRMIR